MKVLHLISSAGMYGAEAVILNLSRALNAAGHESIIGLFNNLEQPNLELRDAAAQHGIAVHLIPCSGQLDPKVPTRIRALVQQCAADVVHAHGYKADFYTFASQRKSAFPIVSTCHNWIGHDLSVRVYGQLDRLVLRRFDGVVAVSEEVKQQLLSAGVRPERIRLIPNGIDLLPFDSAAPGGEAHAANAPLTVGIVARLSAEKGVDLFIRAAASVLSQWPDTHFVAAGEGADRAQLEALIAELGIGSHVRLVGRCDDMPAFYRSLDVLVSASRMEGLPIALLEGMASRLPIVATRVGDVPSVIRDGETGLLVPPEQVDPLAHAILSLLQDPARRKQLGNAAHALIAEQFSADRMAQNYMQLYREVARA